MPMTVSKILYTFTGGYLDFEVLDLSLPGLYVNLAWVNVNDWAHFYGHYLFLHEDKYYMRNKNNKITQKRQ
jgi:hypothetical protein